jgi:hypothetical protein
VTHRPRGPALRLALIALLAIFGGAIGLLGAFVQADRAILVIASRDLVVPWGLVIVWVALVAAVRAGAWLVMRRWGGWTVLAGWLLVTILMSTESPSGDLALSGGGRQMAYLLGGVVLGSAAATLRVAVGTRARPEPKGPVDRL